MGRDVLFWYLGESGVVGNVKCVKRVGWDYVFNESVWLLF